MEADHAPSAAIHALTAKETTRMKPIASTSANEKKAFFDKAGVLEGPLAAIASRSIYAVRY
jgi:hypothetical protein